MIDFAFQVIALLLISTRTIIPDWLSINVANTLAMAGAVLGLIGLEKLLLGKTGKQYHNWILVTLYTIIHFYFTFMQPNLAIRNINSSATFILLSIQYVWLMWKRVPFYQRKLTTNIGFIFALYALVNVIRIVDFFIHSYQATDYFHSSGFEAFCMFSYQILFLLFTYSLALMLNKQLLQDNALQEEKFTKAFHASSSCMLLSRLPDGHIFEVNQVFCNKTGYVTAEVIGKTTVDLKLWENDTDRDAVLNQLISQGKVKELEFRFRKKSGDFFWGVISSELIEINGEKCIISNISDISERKKTELELIESDEFNKTLLKTIPFGMDIVDQNGNVLFLNDKLLEIFGEEAIGRKCWSLYQDTKTQCNDCPLHRDIELGKTETYEAHKALGNQILEVKHTGMMFKGQKAMLEIFQNITERKNAEAQLQQYAKELKLANDTKSKLFSIIGHDLRSPFTTITGFSEMIRDEVDQLDKETIRNYANIVNSSAIYTQNLFQNLLEWARVQQGQLAFSPETINLYSIVIEIQELLAGSAEKKNITIENKVAEGFEVYADLNMLKTTIRNLISNALKYTPNGGKIVINARNENNAISIIVTDNGTGMDAQTLEKLFKPGTNQSAPGTEDEKGTGLGLLLCKEFVELHGGKIWAESPIGKGNTGSKFIFTLPKQIIK